MPTKPLLDCVIGVVSASHVKCGELEGFSQLCHGKSVPLRKMRGNVYELRRGGSGMSPDDYKTFKGTSTFDLSKKVQAN